ncbi:MAG: hypothetical protein LM593_06555 [Candidatus Verstraetearchaeota archaeon]|jgi:hypothetical protein|nr:hypothetical protein [Candidatus Verstraetearchaeota archaeon]
MEVEVKEEKKVCKYCGSTKVNKLGFVPTVKGKKEDIFVGNAVIPSIEILLLIHNCFF